MLRSFAAILFAALLATAVAAPLRAQMGYGGARLLSGHARHEKPLPPQETGFLNRHIEVNGIPYRFQIYLPEDFHRDPHHPWPIVLFLHGRGERGSEGMWQTQVGLPQALRDHPERWPFIVVMPQCPWGEFWTDPAMLTMAMAALDQETVEFQADPDRTYITGLSMGGYGAWELIKKYPHRWAAAAIAAGGIFWSYQPERWQQAATLPGEYARVLGHTSVWMFHGTDDNVVIPRQDELMLEAIKANGGRARLWLYQGLKHDCWTRAFNEMDLPRWLLSHHLEAKPPDAKSAKEPEPYAERTLVPIHPPAMKMAAAQLDTYVGVYGDASGRWDVTIFRQGDDLYEKNPYGEVSEIAPENTNSFFYPTGPSLSRLTVVRNPQGKITALNFRDDRHEEHWEKKK